MSNVLIAICLIGCSLILVAVQEFRSRNYGDGRLAAGAGSLIVVASAAASLFFE